MTNEERIERIVEDLTNCIDRSLMNGRRTQSEYDAVAARLSKWADRAYAGRAPITRTDAETFMLVDELRAAMARAEIERAHWDALYDA